MIGASEPVSNVHSTRRRGQAVAAQRFLGNYICYHVYLDLFGPNGKKKEEDFTLPELSASPQVKTPIVETCQDSVRRLGNGQGPPPTG